MAAVFHLVDMDMIWSGYRYELAAWMARLPTAFLATFMSYAFGFLGQSITGGGLPLLLLFFAV